MCVSNILAAQAPGLVLAPYNPGWKEHRRFILMTLRNFGLGKQSMEQKILGQTHRIIKRLEETDGIIQLSPTNHDTKVMFGIFFVFQGSSLTHTKSSTVHPPTSSVKSCLLSSLMMKMISWSFLQTFFKSFLKLLMGPGVWWVLFDSCVTNDIMNYKLIYSQKQRLLWHKMPKLCKKLVDLSLVYPSLRNTNQIKLKLVSYGLEQHPPPSTFSC